MSVKVEAFKCEYCGKLLKFPRTAAVHEASCKNNPATRNCITCIHGIKAVIRYAQGGFEPNGDAGIEVKGPYCGYHDKPIHEKPYFIDCDNGGGFNTGVGYHPEFPIPYTCFHYENKGKAEWTPAEEYEKGDHANE